MGMGVGPNRGIKSEINVTPLVDVVLVLLIIFMVATPILQMGLDVEVPPKVEIHGAPPPSEQTQLVVTVKHDGIYLNTQKVGSPRELANRIGAQMQNRKPADRVVFINAENDVPFQNAVTAMDAAYEGGAVKIGFLTDVPK